MTKHSGPGDKRFTGTDFEHPLEHSLVKGERYRCNSYFLEDQIKCSDAVNDFRSVKQTVSSLPQFSLKQAFRFAEVPVKTQTGKHR